MFFWRGGGEERATKLSPNLLKVSPEFLQNFMSSKLLKSHNTSYNTCEVKYKLEVTLIWRRLYIQDIVLNYLYILLTMKKSYGTVQYLSRAYHFTQFNGALHKQGITDGWKILVPAIIQITKERHCNPVKEVNECVQDTEQHVLQIRHFAVPLQNNLINGECI